MVRLWLSRLLQLTSLRIIVMFARLDQASVRHMLGDPPTQRVTLMSVPVVRAAENGTLPHYRLMHTKLHAWSLPCARVALLDYDVIAIRDPSPIFDACGAASFCGAQDFSTPGLRGRSFNGGVLVLRPDNATHRRLVAAAEDDAQRGIGRQYAEQAFLNDHFRGAWTQLANRFNLQGAWSPLKQHRAVRDGVLLHQKLSQLPSSVEEALAPRGTDEAAAALVERGLQALRAARFPVQRGAAKSLPRLADPDATVAAGTHQNFTLVTRGDRCNDGGPYDSRGDELHRTRVSNWTQCADLCTANRRCAFFSYMGRGAPRICTLSSSCELSQEPPKRGHAGTSAWARGAIDFVRVKPLRLLAELLAPLDLNGSYSRQLYGARNRMPPIERLRIIWSQLLPDWAVTALSKAAPVCRHMARTPWRPFYSMQDLIFANPQDALWLHSVPSSAPPAANHSWIEVAHCPDRRKKERDARSPAFKFGPLWLYAAEGSGVWVNVGRTIAVAEYKDAAAIIEHALPGNTRLYPLTAADGCNRTFEPAVPLASASRFPLASSVIKWASTPNATPPERYTPGHRNELLTPSMMQGFLENPTNRKRAELAASSDVANLDSIQILSNQEWFAVTEKRREIVMIRGRDCATLGSGGGVPEVRCGKPPHLFPCSAAALARLSTCTGIGGIFSKRSRKLGLEANHPTCHRAICYSRAGSAHEAWCPAPPAELGRVDGLPDFSGQGVAV